MGWFVLVFLGRHHRLLKTGWLNQQKIFPHGSGGKKSEIKVLGSLFSVSPLLLAHKWPPAKGSHMAFALCLCRKRVSCHVHKQENEGRCFVSVPFFIRSLILLD